LARAGRHETEEGALARAVRANQREQLGRARSRGQPLERLDTPEAIFKPRAVIIDPRLRDLRHAGHDHLGGLSRPEGGVPAGVDIDLPA